MDMTPPPSQPPSKRKGEDARLQELRERWWPASFGLLNNARAARDWTQEELARRMQYGPHEIYRKSMPWELPGGPLDLPVDPSWR